MPHSALLKTFSDDVQQLVPLLTREEETECTELAIRVIETAQELSKSGQRGKVPLGPLTPPMDNWVVSFYAHGVHKPFLFGWHRFLCVLSGGLDIRFGVRRDTQEAPIAELRPGSLAWIPALVPLHYTCLEHAVVLESSVHRQTPCLPPFPLINGAHGTKDIVHYVHPALSRSSAS